MTARRTALLLPMLASRRAAAADGDTTLDALLARHVIPHTDGVNRVRYATWKASAADRAALDAWVAGAESRRPSGMGRAEPSRSGRTSTTR